MDHYKLKKKLSLITENITSIIESRNTHKIIAISLFTLLILLIFYTTWHTSPYLSGKKSLFTIEAKTNYIEISPHKNGNYPTWEIEKGRLYDNCSKDSEISFSGSVFINPYSTIEFINDLSETLVIYLNSESDTSSGRVITNTAEIMLSDCAALKIDNSLESIFLIDGVIELGTEVNENTTNNAILKSGSVTISDKRIFSNDYYQNTPRPLKMGDKFLVKLPESQSSGFVHFKRGQYMYTSYQSTGQEGVIQRYKSEDIIIKNSIWDKIKNDDILTFLWIAIIFTSGLIRTFIMLIRKP
ncbi:hypothetical protein [Enterovibrio coralii]|uniref:Uncharacterized protein n=1 Tax=Enterovibrio coralii TaxID=294935 RepID=A0A135I9H1_9GAMM|nr:hypothetical protein [Enterovibrio coralii]KXF82100.1 hypothetical protein ATN88_20120 [Enterovibrio coralii]